MLRSPGATARPTPSGTEPPTHPEEHQMESESFGTSGKSERSPEESEREIAGTRAAIDSTVEELGERLGPSHLMEEARSYVRDTASRGASSAWETMSSTVRDNAVPLALIGSGVAWWMMSRRNGDGYDYEYGEYGAYEGDYGEPRYPRTSGYGAGTGVETSPSYYAQEPGREQSPGMTEKASERASRTGEKVGELASRTAERARDVSHRLRERSAGVGGAAQQQMQRARETVSSMSDEQPLLLGVASFAFGALVGGLLPITRRENQLLGHARDQVVETAAEAGREKVEEVRHAAEEAARRQQQAAHQQQSGPSGQQPGAQGSDRKASL